MYECECVCACVCVCVCARGHARAHVCVCMCMSVSACMQTHVYTCVHEFALPLGVLMFSYKPL